MMFLPDGEPVRLGPLLSDDEILSLYDLDEVVRAPLIEWSQLYLTDPEAG